MENFIKITKLKPSICSENEGDFIIEDYCSRILSSLFTNAFYIDLPTQTALSKAGYRHLATSDVSFVLGTNLLASTKKTLRQWHIGLYDSFRIKYGDISRRQMLNPINYINKHTMTDIVLMGVGWWQYQEKPDRYMQRLLKAMLSGRYTHSVRDEYTKKMLNSVGINNVLNTACPTMWGLTEGFCEKIPKNKSGAVVTTLTDYYRADTYDKELLRILTDNYSDVYIWPQSKKDCEYIRQLHLDGKVKILAPGLKHYDEFLKANAVDYVGTRLHGGIRALNHARRSIIISVDNRAVEISKSTNLPVIKREDISERLDRRINSCDATNIVLPQAEIDEWKAQFDGVKK